jgi:hypothetical protein
MENEIKVLQEEKANEVELKKFIRENIPDISSIENGLQNHLVKFSQIDNYLDKYLPVRVQR